MVRAMSGENEYLAKSETRRIPRVTDYNDKSTQYQYQANGSLTLSLDKTLPKPKTTFRYVYGTYLNSNSIQRL